MDALVNGGAENLRINKLKVGKTNCVEEVKLMINHFLTFVGRADPSFWDSSHVFFSFHFQHPLHRPN